MTCLLLFDPPSPCSGVMGHTNPWATLPRPPVHLPNQEGLSKKHPGVGNSTLSPIVSTMFMSSYDTGKGQGDPRPGFWSKKVLEGYLV